jgi:NADPH-dependent 2,4-dienoyl-CoA reductase/sulfur reductase-like enzyme
MGVGGAQAMLKSGMDVRNKRVVIAGSGPLLLPVAAAMAKAGARVVSVAEQASAMRLGAFALSLWSKPATLVTAARYRAAFPLQAYRSHSWVERAEGTGRVERVTLRAGSRMWTEPCNLLCCSYGLVPAIDLARLLGCRVEDGCVIVDDAQATTVPGVFSAGETTGIAGEAAAIVEGEIAGLIAASTTSTASSISPALRRHQTDGRAFVRRLRDTFRLDPALRTLALPDTIICRCEDVRHADFDPSWTGRQAKLYTRAGMGPCQGAVCGPALERIFGWSAGSVRPPLLAPALDAWMADPVDPAANV